MNATLMNTPILTARHLNKVVPSAEGELSILHDLSLDLCRGDSLAIVGSSGSGKSTLLGLLAGLDLPSQGSVQLAGHDLGQLDEDQRARVRAEHVGFVFQSFQLLDSLNALENVMLPLELEGHADARQRARALLERVGLGHRLSHYPRQLSGGEQQRVAIARSLAPSPAVLIADEPTTALDVTVQAQILEVIQRVQQTFGTAVVLITHDLGVIARVADSVNVMYAGRNVESGSVQSIFDHPSHPYTRGLLSSLPHEGIERLHPIAGFPPNMLAPPSGCGFAPRCQHAIEACSAELPSLSPFEDLLTSCIRADELRVGRRS